MAIEFSINVCKANGSASTSVKLTVIEFIVHEVLKSLFVKLLGNKVLIFALSLSSL